MVQLTRIYTKGGDKGKTSLGSGNRLSKSSLHIAAIGDVGADLCMPLDNQPEDGLRIVSSQVSFLEEKIDFFNKTLSPLKSFVLPGGSSLSAALHQARAVVRRAERSICGLHEKEGVNEVIIHYMNRLSDLLFVMARYDNHQHSGDILWVPGAHR